MNIVPHCVVYSIDFIHPVLNNLFFVAFLIKPYREFVDLHIEILSIVRDTCIHSLKLHSSRGSEWKGGKNKIYQNKHKSRHLLNEKIP